MVAEALAHLAVGRMHAGTASMVPGHTGALPLTSLPAAETSLLHGGQGFQRGAGEPACLLRNCAQLP